MPAGRRDPVRILLTELHRSWRGLLAHFGERKAHWNKPEPIGGMDRRPWLFLFAGVQGSPWHTVGIREENPDGVGAAF